MYNLGKIALIYFAILLSAIVMSSNGSKDVLYSPQKRNAKEMKQWAALFTDYNLYFNTAIQMEWSGREFMKKNDSSPFSSDVARRIMCSNPKYQPRVLLRNQITWKMKSSDEFKSKKGFNATGSTASDGDGSDSSSANRSALSSSTATETKEREIVHNFMIFALLLPSHPFSRELYNSIAVVAPMFPTVTVVVGNAYEFRDMANKYLISSYPKLLFFKAGIFMGVFDSSSRDPTNVAGQIAKWTKQLPVAVPYRPKEVPTQPAVRFVHWKREIDLSPLCSWVAPSLPVGILSAESFEGGGSPYGYCSQFCTVDGQGRWTGPVLPVALSIPLPSPHIEPFLGSLHAHSAWDGSVFFCSAVFCIVKLLYFFVRSDAAT